MRTLEVQAPGFLTTVQDLGRYGYLRYGVPISGAMDVFSLTTANLLVGNDPNDAGLEMTITGPELSVLTNTQIAVTGGAISPEVNGRNVPMWQTVNVQLGDVISFGKMESGCRSYLAFRGGIDAASVLGSRSTYVRGCFGGIDGRQLRARDNIEGFEVASLEDEYRVPDDLVPQFRRDLRVYVILGPQADMFTEAGIETFFSSQYKVTSEADRMGYRLEGPLIEHRGKADIVSDALLPGAVQVPKNGKPIVMMCDAQTTGGYSKIAVVCTSDLSMLGQARPDSRIQFSKITVAEAHRRLQEQNKLLRNLSGMLTRVR